MAPVVQLLAAVSILLIGTAAGRWLRPSTGHSSPSTEIPPQLHLARQLLARLHQALAALAADLSGQAAKLDRFERQLADTPTVDASEARNAVAQLVEANREIRRRVDEAESFLREQSRRLLGSEAAKGIDPATGLADGETLREELDRIVLQRRGRGEPLSVVLVDVDQLRHGNARHGMEAEGQILRNVTGVLRRTMGHADVIARSGHEQFAAVLPGLSSRDAARTAEQARRAMEDAPIEVDEECVTVTGSFGVAELGEGEDAAGLLRRAGAALAVSKRVGNNCVHWHDGRVVRRAKAEPEKPTAAPQRSEPGEGPEQAGPAPLSDESWELGLPQAELESPAGDEVEADPTNSREPASPTPQPKDQATIQNRTGFCQHVHRHVAAAREGGPAVSVVMLEVDALEEIADRFGRRGAEIVLRATERFVLAVARSRDVVARYAPTCFAMLLPGMSQSQATALAEQLRTAIARCALALNGEQIRFTVSAGVAELGGGENLVQLLERAEDGVRQGHLGTAGEPRRVESPAVAG